MEIILKKFNALQYAKLIIFSEFGRHEVGATKGVDRKISRGEGGNEKNIENSKKKMKIALIAQLIYLPATPMVQRYTECSLLENDN